MQQVSVLETNIGSSTTGNSANTQVIFNDAGTLRGDAGLTYNKTTDLLSVGAATITGDLTVDTSTLKVDSANNRVGIGTATPARPLDIVGSFQSTLGWVLTGTPAGLGGATRYIGGASTTDSWYYNAVTGGSHLWAFGESLAMTLNSTGLGVGYTPSGSADKIGAAATLGVVATGATADLNFRNSSLTAIQRIRYTDGTGTLTIGSASTISYQVELGGNTTTRAVTIDTSGNVGVGVTPSYLLHTAVASGANRNIARFQVTGASNGLTITWNHATTKMIVNFSDLPTSSAGLASGDLWIDTTAGNTLKVA